MANEINKARNRFPNTQKAELVNRPNLYSFVINCSWLIPHNTYEICNPTKQNSNFMFRVNKSACALLPVLSSEIVKGSTCCSLTPPISSPPPPLAANRCKVFIAV